MLHQSFAVRHLFFCGESSLSLCDLHSCYTEQTPESMRLQSTTSSSLVMPDWTQKSGEMMITVQIVPVCICLQYKPLALHKEPRRTSGKVICKVIHMHKYEQEAAEAQTLAYSSTWTYLYITQVQTLWWRERGR